LAASLKNLTGRVIGCSPEQIRRAAFLFAHMKVIIKPLDRNKMCANKDWISGLLKRNGNFALKKPEGLLRGRAQGLNNMAVDYFFIYSEIVYGTQYP
jgi:hypothetical protein